MKGQVVRAATAVFVGMTLVLLIGCRSDVSEDPFLLEKFRKIETDLDKVRNVPLKIEDLQADIQALDVRIGLLEKNPATGGAQAVAAELKKIQDQINSLNQRVAKLQADLVNLSKRPPALRPTPRISNRPTPRVTPPKPAPKTTGPKPTPTIKLKTTPVKPTPVKPVPSVPRGAYHQAEEGDTLQSFANRYKISVEALIKANPRVLGRFKAADKLPLQQYWVPAK